MYAADACGGCADDRTWRLVASPGGVIRGLLRSMTTAAAGERGVIIRHCRGTFVPVTAVDLREDGDLDFADLQPALGPPLSVLRRVVRERRSLSVPAADRADGRPGLCLPLVCTDKVVGVLYIERRHPTPVTFTAEQRRLVADLAEQAVTTVKLVDDYGEQMRALEAKVNPQFLHNTLSVIAELVSADATKAEEAIVMLSRLYRYVLDSSSDRIVTLAQEVAMSRDYLTLEQYRLGKRMRADIKVQGPLDRVHIPCLLLQAVIESSVSHGVARKVGEGSILVEVSVNQLRCRLRVQDDGPPWGERGARAAPGLRKVRKILALHYPHRHSFRIEKRDGVAIEIRIPRRRPGSAETEMLATTPPPLHRKVRQ